MSITKLIEVVRNYGLRWAPDGQEFTLASGAKSKFYIDFSKVMFVPYAASVIVDCLVDKLRRVTYDRIGGPMSGADPIIGGLMVQLAIPLSIIGNDARGFVVRKEPKGRGPDEGSLIEGYLDQGDRVVLIEDVTTSGGSVLKAISAVEARGATVVKVISLLDRLAGAGDRLAKYDFEALITLKDLGID